MGSADFRMIRPVGVTADGAFSRASPKWVFDKAGTLVQVPVDTLAVTYDPSDLSKAPYAAIDLQPATNLCTSSASVVGNWLPNVGTFDNANYPDPAGGTLASRWTLNGNGDGKFCKPTITDGATYTLRFMYRRVSGSGTIYCGHETPPQNLYIDTVTNQSAGTNGAPKYKIINCTNGWTWVFVVFVAGGNKTATIYGASPNNLVLDMFDAEILEGENYSMPVIGASRAADIIAPGAGLVYSNVPIAEPTYNAGTTYAANALVYDPVKRGVFQSLIAGNVGRALTDTTAWTPQLATNRWRMFDKAVNSQTSAPELLVVAVQPGALVNTSGLLNVAGSRVSVTQTESYYTASKSLVRHEVLNWYDFFYEEPIREGDVVFDGIPPYATSTLIYVVENPGDVAAVGACIIGKSRTIGQTAWDFTGGILSYSSTSTDTFGNLTLVRRDNAKTLNFEVYIPKGFESEAYRLLRDYTDVEMMIIGAEDYSMTYSYGYLGQWSVPVTNSNKTAHIEWKGLV